MAKQCSVANKLMLTTDKRTSRDISPPESERRDGRERWTNTSIFLQVWVVWSLGWTRRVVRIPYPGEVDSS
jgi:hypothetical protein